MNQTINSILNRRSIRAYQADQIPSEDLSLILEAGKFAPSAMNNQPWHFVAIQNAELLDKINRICKDMMLNSGIETYVNRAKSEQFNAFYHAPTLILVFVDEKGIAPECDGSLALANMFIAAESLGIGSCWIHAMPSIFNSPNMGELKKELGVPEGYKAIGSGVFGYKKNEPVAPARKEGTVSIFK